MAKYIHVMIRVVDENRSKAFYEKAFGFQEAARFPFETFTLVYLLDKESGTELELTVNHDRKEPYTHGDGYGHIAMAVDIWRQSTNGTRNSDINRRTSRSSTETAR